MNNSSEIFTAEGHDVENSTQESLYTNPSSKFAIIHRVSSYSLQATFPVVLNYCFISRV